MALETSRNKFTYNFKIYGFLKYDRTDEFERFAEAMSNGHEDFTTYSCKGAIEIEYDREATSLGAAIDSAIGELGHSGLFVMTSVTWMSLCPELFEG